METVKNKVVLITGAAHGLGRALATLFLSKGWGVIATDVDYPAMQDLKNNPDSWVIEMDVASDESVKAAFGKVKQEKINIDVIINNAGIDRYFPLSEAPVDMIKHVFEVNLFGGCRVNQVFLPLVKKPGGKILQISSESLHLNVPFMPYPISKMAVEGYARTLRLELKFSGVEVIIVRPGAIRTRLLENVISLKSKEGDADIAMKKTMEQWQLDKQIERFAELAPKNIGKILEPEQVAGFIYKIAQKRKPKSIYRINNSLALRFAALLPSVIMERMIYKKLKD